MLYQIICLSQISNIQLFLLLDPQISVRKTSQAQNIYLRPDVTPAGSGIHPPELIFFHTCILATKNILMTGGGCITGGYRDYASRYPPGSVTRSYGLMILFPPSFPSNSQDYEQFLAVSFFLCYF